MEHSFWRVCCWNSIREKLVFTFTFLRVFCKIIKKTTYSAKLFKAVIKLVFIKKMKRFKVLWSWDYDFQQNKTWKCSTEIVSRLIGILRSSKKIPWNKDHIKNLSLYLNGNPWFYNAFNFMVSYINISKVHFQNFWAGVYCKPSRMVSILNSFS